jgi:hypothetical protein
MSYRYIRFAGVDLPTADGREDLDREGRVALIEVAGGQVFDPLGSDQAPAGERTIRARYVMTAATAAAFRTAYNAYRALQGKRGELWREHDTGDNEFIYARLLKFRGERETHNVVSLPVTFEFLILESDWRGDSTGQGWYLNSGIYLNSGRFLNEEAADEIVLDTSPKTCTVTNGGNKPITDLVITVTAGAADITALTIACSNDEGTYSITYSGGIKSGESLVIGCGARTVKNDGVADFDHFTLGGTHNRAKWLVLAAGSNPVTVTKTGGSTDSTILFSFFDKWA